MLLLKGLKLLLESDNGSLPKDEISEKGRAEWKVSRSEANEL